MSWKNRGGLVLFQSQSSSEESAEIAFYCYYYNHYCPKLPPSRIGSWLFRRTLQTIPRNHYALFPSRLHHIFFSSVRLSAWEYLFYCNYIIIFFAGIVFGTIILKIDSHHVPRKWSLTGSIKRRRDRVIVSVANNWIISWEGSTRSPFKMLPVTFKKRGKTVMTLSLSLSFAHLSGK